MLILIFMLVLVGLSLGVLFYVGTLFLQGYLYTQPVEELYWRAPAAAGAITFLIVVWCMLIAFSPTATRTDIPYNGLFHFSPQVDMVEQPVPELWAVNKKDEKVLYKRHKAPGLGASRIEYRDTTVDERPWRSTGVKSIIIKNEGQDYVFNLVPTPEGGYREFVSPEGWSMKETEDGPTGTPTIFRWGRFFGNLFLNFLHLALWIVCPWLILRFFPGHAILIGLVAWGAITLFLLPALLADAAEVAQNRRVASVERRYLDSPVYATCHETSQRFTSFSACVLVYWPFAQKALPRCLRPGSDSKAA